MQDSLERDKKIRNQWTLLTKRVTHERGVWSLSDHQSARWKLDGTEGTDRMRPRLKRFASHLPFLTASASNLSTQQRSSKDSKDFISPGSNLFQVHSVEILAQQNKDRLELLFGEHSGNDANSENYGQTHLKPGERILSYFKCSRITPFSKTDGEILIGTYFHFYFIYSLKEKVTVILLMITKK